MVKLFDSKSKNPFNLNIKNLVIENQQENHKWQHRVVFDERDLEHHIPHVSHCIAIEDLYILVFSYVEHSRGASSMHDKVEVLSPGGKCLCTIHGAFSSNALVQFTDRPGLGPNLLLIAHLHSGYFYNHVVNHGKPCIELQYFSLPGGGRKNSYPVDLPDDKKHLYNHENISYFEARFEKEGKDFFAHCRVYNTSKCQQNLNFSEKVRYS